MYYEINVSLNGRHFFATAERSLQTIDEYNNAIEIFKIKFPESEGFKITATKWNCSGEVLRV